MDNMAADGELNSRIFPLADTSRRDFPIEDPVDCTWEMVVKNGKRVRLTSSAWQKLNLKFTFTLTQQPLLHERKENINLSAQTIYI